MVYILCISDPSKICMYVQYCIAHIGGGYSN